ncbi:ABC transporter permease [Maledivibacter halophilus]|uniref:Glycine betaine/proline transport system permease protein n=1 Tax=Maledivibacter halophilus TaxID=36842 RepID=A0A1T5J6P7_9FIRM|nr:proline/glycine betaine ABC transporter permease [Maledivibacter halophilus]SKC46928.1 glycine betaine/proline transport system permease protein [Maledivibacter halophilus]
MFEFPDNLRFKIGIYVENFVEWLTENFSFVFDSIQAGVLWFLLKVQSALLIVPWIVVVILIFLLGWKAKNWKYGLTFGLMVFLIGTFGLWDEMMLTLAIVLTSVIISLVFGIPVGILIAYKKRAESIITPILDAMQTMPSFVYLIPAIMLFDLGTVPAVFATTIYALPPVIRLTNLAIQRVSKEMVEASNSFGASPWQTLIKVELPQALPTIMAGINQTTMMAMSMVVVTSMIGAKGLGMNVMVAINRIDIAMGFEAGISIVFLAIIIDRLTQGVADRFKYPE